MYITNQAQQQVTEPNTASLHQQAASQNQVCELCAAKQGQMASNSGQRREGRGRGGNTLTRRPGACLDGMAGQCPRGQPGATRGCLHRAHREHRTSALPPACTHTPRPPVVAHQAPGEGSARHRAGGDRSRRKPRGNQPRISSERKRPSNPVGGGGRGR
jgi:hypothetical protein